MSPIFLEIDGQQVEAMPFGHDRLIKGTEPDRLTIVWDTGDVGAVNRWGAEDTVRDPTDEEFQDDFDLIIGALDHFWPGWAERASVGT